MRCAIYCRLSREDENKSDESESIHNQRLLLRQYAADRGWTVCAEYADDDRSGIDAERPGFLSLLRDAEAGRFEVLLCKTQSRFTRDLELSEHYLHRRFDEWGVRFISVVDGVDTLRRDNLKTRQLGGLINEWYLADLSDNVRAVLDAKRRRGDFIGSFAPYGYKKSEIRRGRLVPDPEPATVVREIFTLAGEGVSRAEIARRLTARGIPNPTAYKLAHGERYYNGGSHGSPGKYSAECSAECSAEWNRSTVSRILRSECYLGAAVQGKREKVSYKSKKLRERDRSEWIVVHDVNEPLVTTEIFAAAQRYHI